MSEVSSQCQDLHVWQRLLSFIVAYVVLWRNHVLKWLTFMISMMWSTCQFVKLVTVKVSSRLVRTYLWGNFHFLPLAVFCGSQHLSKTQICVVCVGLIKQFGGVTDWSDNLSNRRVNTKTTEFTFESTSSMMATLSVARSGPGNRACSISGVSAATTWSGNSSALAGIAVAMLNTTNEVSYTNVCMCSRCTMK